MLFRLVLQRHCRENEKYMDNFITDTDSDFEDIAFYNGANEILKTAFVNLREWLSISNIYNSYIPEDYEAEESFLTVL
jgi:hypothetical protein